MSNDDIGINVTNMSMNTKLVVQRPRYLISLDVTNGKIHSVERFITLDKLDWLTGFVQAKGIFSDITEAEIIKNFQDILTAAPKESILEMIFPVHRILSIRNLIFNAIKTVQK